MKRETKTRLIKHIAFLEEELQDSNHFEALSWEEYRKERTKRRDVERWIENIVNSSIDIAKIILVSENIPLPETYKELVASLALIPDFDAERQKTLSEWVRFRNVITHEYLDIRWASIRRFIEEARPLYEHFAKDVSEYIKQRIES